jgi:signal transduction histidine kinase/CheY-like chemotaxis protein
MASFAQCGAVSLQASKLLDYNPDTFVVGAEKMTDRPRRLLAFLLCALLSLGALLHSNGSLANNAAVEPVVSALEIDRNFHYASLHDHLAIYVDKSPPQLTPWQFVDVWNAVPWNKAATVHLDMYSNATFWLARPLRNMTPQQRLLILSVPSPRVFDWGAYWLSNGKVTQIHDRLREDGNTATPLQAPTPALPLQLESNEEGVLLFRMTGRAHYLINRSTLADYRSFHDDFLWHERITAVFVGLIVAMLIYHFAMWWAIRDPIMLLFCAFVTVTLVCIMLDRGYQTELLDVQTDILTRNAAIDGFIYTLSPIVGLLFTRSFFALPLRSPRCARTMKNVALILPLFWLLVLVYPVPVKVMVLYLLLTAYSVMIGQVVTSIYWWRKGASGALLYLASWILMLVSTLTTLIARFTDIRFDDFRLDGDLIQLGAAAAQIALMASALTRLVSDLRKKELQAQAESRAKSEFLAVMSHEIRTPMNGVLGMAELLKGTSLDDRQQLYIDTIHRSGRSLLRVLNDILDFSKVEAGKLQLEHSTIDLDQLVHNVIAPYQVSGGSEVAFNIHIAPDTPRYLAGDGGRISQVIGNLLNNAFKFTRKGHVYLRLDIAASEPERVKLRVVVGDSGPGIALEQQARLFSPFTQANAGISREYGGTGLGLAICKRLVEIMGGNISFVSEPGKGARFEFSLWLEKRGPDTTAFVANTSDVTTAVLASTEQTDDTARDIVVSNAHTLDGGANLQTAANDSGGNRAAEDATPAGFSIKRVLVAEDNITNQLVTTGMLKRLGIESVLANDGAAAINAATAQHANFDAILMDCEMPQVDGFEATRQIRLHERSHAKTPVRIIALTAHAMPEFQQRSVLAGMNGYLTKPVSLRALAQALTTDCAAGGQRD